MNLCEWHKDQYEIDEEIGDEVNNYNLIEPERDVDES